MKNITIRTSRSIWRLEVGEKGSQEMENLRAWLNLQSRNRWILAPLLFAGTVAVMKLLDQPRKQGGQRLKTGGNGRIFSFFLFGTNWKRIKRKKMEEDIAESTRGDDVDKLKLWDGPNVPRRTKIFPTWPKTWGHGF